MSSERKEGVNRGNAGKGRPKGTPNKTTALLKDAILIAAEQAGGKDGLVGYLTIQANVNPTAFMSLLGKVLPLQIAHSGNVGLTVEIVKFSDAHPPAGE